MSETPGPFGYAQDPRWVAISGYSIGPDNVALPFVERLARDNGWIRADAERVITEYKRFTYLSLVAGHEVTPSDAVDQAWHLHLTYTRDYWERFCPQVLGQPLHHGPTAGGSVERNRYFENYANTLKSYEQVFGEPAPADLWPSAARRLIEDPKARRLHPRDGVLVPRSVSKTVFVIIVVLIIAHLV